uniref:Desmoplakin n=1 Tax=Salmo trutta TaxID=8032 RepID=A0A673Y9J8_SALTR
MWLLHGCDIFVFQRLIETSHWGDDSAAIEQQLISHNKFHSSIQRSAEVDKAKDELVYVSPCFVCQKMSHGRSNQLRELQQIIEEISREIMWVNEREEEELVFDWGEKNIDLYIPKKQESYSKLMSTLEEKEKDLNKLKLKVDSLLKNHHPASDKIEAYMDTLQTQWSWLLQITKCIHVHLKENAAYSQFFKEANETYSKLQKEHENIRRKFTSDRNTPLENLLELLNSLEKEKEWILENKRQVQHLVNMSKSIVRLRPRNPEEEKSSSPVMVQALCDFKQDQKVILKGNEGILKDNSQRSKWQVTGPGGLDMLVPSVCLLVPPPNSLGINLANKNEQYYEAILSVWNQLYINIKSLISWQYCVQDIARINSLTITMVRTYHHRNHITSSLSLQFHLQGPRLTQMSTNSSIHTLIAQIELICSDESSLSFFASLPRLFLFSVLPPFPTPRLRALRALLESESRAEDIIKVHEARLTEKETTSLDPAEVEDYRSTLKSMRAELEGKRDILVSMETELGKAVHWNGQVGGTFHRCDVDLSRYSEQVTQLSDRWRRLQSQIDFRYTDLSISYLFLSEWIGTTRQKQDALQATKIDSITALDEHLNQQKALNSEIKVKRESVESVLRDTDACVNSIKDYELELASYSAGLETLLNIPMKRTMPQSPSTQLTEEATLLQTRYIELLTLSGDYYKYLGELHKNMEELKMRNTRIDLLEEELRLLKEDIRYRNTKNSSLEEALARYRLELSQSQEQLHSVEEVKRSKALQCSVTQDSLASTHSQLKELQEQVARLTSIIEEEKRKRMLAEERYREQQEEHEQVLRRRQKELEEANWAKMEVEKSVGDRDREAERLRRQLEEEVRRCKDLEQELSKVRSQCSVEISNLKLSYESQITFCRTDIQHLSAQREEVDQGIRLQCDKLEAERRDQEDQLRRLKVCLSQAEEQRRRAEEEAHAQKSVVTEEVRRRRELEAQVEMLVRERGEDSNQYREEVSELTKALQERSGQQVLLTHSLEEEQRRRRALEEERIRLELLLGEIQAKQASYSQAVTRLRELEEELVSISTEFKKENGEKNKAEQSVTRLQGQVRELQATADRLEGEAEALRRTNQEEVTKRRLVETELQKTTHTMREYTSTIATLRRSQEEAQTTGRRGEEEHRKLQVELESKLKEFKASTERLTSLSSELKSLQQQLLQEQAKVREANMRNETLYKTIEEKSLALNESSVERERLQTLTQTLTKERLRLEEELRGVKHEREELLRTRQGADDELVSQNTALELQLKSSLRSSVETQILVAELSSEREKLRMEIDQVQRQAMETSLIQSTKTQYSEMVVERDALLLKLKQTDQDRARSQKLEEELNRIKLSLESELRLKLRLQEENEKVKNDFLYWKGQYESKEGAVRQFDSVKEKLERERSSLETEIERLMRELREGEDRYKSRLLITQTQLSELTSVRDTLETDLRKLRKQHDACAKHTQTDENGKKDLDPATLDIEDRLRSYLQGSTCIAGVYDEANHKTLSIYQAMKEGLLRPGTTLELLEAQAASGFMIDPINNLCLTVADAYKSGLAGPEFKDKLLSAERAVTGYKDPGTDKIISLFQAIEKGLMEKGHGIRLLEAQIASGGIIDPRHSHRIEVETAYKKGYFGKEMNQILTDEADVSKGFFDPNNQDNLTYLQLKKRCIIDQKTGLVLLPIKDKKKEPPQTTTQKNTLRKRRVVIVDPDTNKEMSVKEAYDKGLIDYETFLELSQQECEWEEITITAQDGSSRLVIIDRKTEIQYDIRELLEKKVIDQSVYDQYRSQKITLAQFAKIITSKTNSTRSSSSTSSSKTRASRSPVGAIFDMEALEKISISEAHKRGLVDSISAQRLLEAQACTGGIVNPSDGRRLSIQEASRQGIIENDMATRLKPAQKAYIGFEDVKCKRKMSAAEAMSEKWLPYEAGHRFLEFQFVTGGLYDPELGRRRTIEEALKVGWLDGRAAQKLQDMRHHAKNLTCPKTKLKISYKEALDNCLLEENTGVKMLQAASTSSRGISSPYNFSSAPGSTSGSRTGSRTGSRRGSVDLGSPSSSSRYSVISSSTYSRTSFSSSSIS